MARISNQDRRRQLQAAALSVLVEHGPAALTTRRVAEHAGAPLASVHYAFQDKDELLGAAVGEVLASFTTALRGTVRPELGLHRAVADALTGYWRWVEAHPGVALAAVETFAGSLRTGTAARAVVDDALDLLVELFTRAAAHDPRAPRTPVPALARAVLVVAEGATLVHLAAGDTAEVDLDTLRTALQALV